MKLELVYLPVPEIAPALAFYRDTLGFDEAWREGDGTIALAVPDSDVMLMLDHETDGRPGPMFTTPSVAEFLERHGDAIDVVIGPHEIPDGTLVGFRDPGGNLVYVLDQRGADGPS